MQKQTLLTKNQQIIFDLIDKSPEPMKAYAILFNVQKKGIKAPLQVYRALDKLVEIGKIHKIESLFSFIDLHDEIFIKKINSKNHKIIFYGKFSKGIFMFFSKSLLS